MPTVAENLLALDAVKDDIKAKISTNLGRTIGAAVPFTDYADYILPPVAWMPDPLWASLDDIADGQIGMIVRDRDDLGVAARCAFTITATASYTVDWGDGNSETIASGTMADHTYTLGAGTPDSKGTTTFKVRISSAGTIARILMANNVTGGVVKQTVQSVNIKAAGITSMSNAFYYCTMLQNVDIAVIPLCTGFVLAFSQCVNLVKISSINAAECTTMASMCAGCGRLQTVGALTIPKCTTLNSTFIDCKNLISIGTVDAPLCSTIQNAFNTCYKLQPIIGLNVLGTSATSVSAVAAFVNNLYVSIVNLSGAKLSRVAANGTTSLTSGITSLIFNASSLFEGTSPQIDVSYTMMDRTALVALFNLLPTLTGKTINITGCIGTADLTAGDRAIATGKGWTIIG